MFTANSHIKKWIISTLNCICNASSELFHLSNGDKIIIAIISLRNPDNDWLVRDFYAITSGNTMIFELHHFLRNVFLK